MLTRLSVYLIALLVIAVIPTDVAAQSVSCPEVTIANQNITFPCSPDTQKCVSVSAAFPDIRQTVNGPNAYVANAIPFSGHALFNFPAGTGNPVLVNQDDRYSGVINLPFTFCYYGNTYNSVVVGANGVLSFNASYAGLGDGYGVDGYTIPSTTIGAGLLINGNKLNAIFACFHDIDPSVAATDKEIEWALIGTAPCRKLVVNWRNIPQFSCTSQLSTFQCVLYENTNVIEMYIEKKPVCSGWQSGKAVIGIQNATGTQAVAAPGRNSTVWTTTTANSEAWQFVPNGSSLLSSVAIYNAAGVLLQSATPGPPSGGLLTATFNNLCVSTATSPAYYYVKANYNSCSGSNFSDTTGLTLTLSPATPPPVVSSPVTYCQNAVAMPLTATGSGLLWYTAPSSGTGNPVSPTPSTTSPGTVVYYVAQVLNGCESIRVPITVNVNSPVTPTFAAAGPYCSGNVIPALPVLSLNGINGSWSPAINNTATTTYTFNPAAGQCASATTKTIVINPYINNAINISRCAGQSYVFNGSTYTTAQSGLKDTFATSGCDSIVTLNLTFNPYINSTVNISRCAGQSYTFNGITYTTSQSGLKDTFATSGCDSIATLNLTFNPYINSTVNISRCAGQSYTFNGITYTTSQSGLKDTFATSGCDSIVTLNLTFNPYINSTVNISRCAGQSYTFNGITYTTSQSGLKDTFATAGCDSIVTLNLTFNPYINSTVNISRCAGQSYTFNGITYTTSQSGLKDTFTTSGCDSIVTLNLTVSPYLTGIDVHNICQGQSYTFNGVTYTTANNTAKDTLSSAGGCDSIVTLNLTVSPYLTGTDIQTICQGQSYTFNGITYTSANNTAKDTLSSAGGCDSIVTLNLTISPYITGTDVQSICQGQSYTFNGVTYTTPNNTAKDTLSSAGGCDSIVTLNLTVNLAITNTLNAAICPGQSYVFNGVSYTTAQSGIIGNFSTAAGCDSVVTFNLTVSPYLTGTDIQTICQGQSYTFNGVTYTTANNTAKDTLSTVGGCDSIVTLNLTVSPYLTGIDVHNICQGQTYTFNGITYTTANSTAKDTLSSAGGCDSIVTLNLTINPAITNTLNAAICPGQSYVFNGVSYTTAQSGITGNFSTAAGCDSVVTFNLTVSPYLTGTEIQSICQGQSYTFNGVTYTSANNTAKDTLSTAGGCDSIVTLNLSVSPYLTGIDIHNICQGQSYTFNGVTYTTANNTAKDTLSTTGGCDSIVTLNLTVNPAITNTLNAAICQGQSYVFNGVSYTTAQSGIIGNFSTPAGCDSVVTFNLTVSPYLTGTDIQSICQGQSYAFNGITYTSANNTAKDTLSSAGGCDSIVTLNLSVSPYLTGTDIQTICQGQSYAFNGITYTSANNTAKDTLSSAGGCDSIVTLNLTVNPAITYTLNAAICPGQSYVFNGVSYTTAQSGIIGNFSTPAGCDSIVTLNLSVSPYLTGIDIHNICQGQSYIFNGITYTTANNTAKDTLSSAGGCDSIVTLNLTVSPYLTGIDVRSICQGQSYVFNGITYTSSNSTAKDTLSTAGGCDSIVTLNLTVNPAITNTLNAAICPGQSYVFNGVSYTTAQSGVIGNFSTAAGCDSVVTFNLAVSPYLTGTDIQTICQGQSYAFNGITYTSANNTAKDTLSSAGGCDSIVTLNLSVSPYLTGTDIQTICQGQSYAFNGITYTSANNTAKDTLSSAGGCDSIVTLNLTVNPAITYTLNAAICQGQSYVFNGVSYTTAQSGVIGNFSTAAGCDSVVTFNLTVSPYLTGIDVQTICQGQGYTFNGITYTTANNTAKDTLSSVGGCDSIVTLNLTVNPAITNTLNAAICPGQSYVFNGVSYTTAQSGITGNFSTAAGCDSVVTFNLTVSPYLTGTDIQTICQGQSYAFNGITYTTANNTAKDTLSSAGGCDSIVTLNLTVSPYLTGTDIQTICQGQSYIFNGVTYTTANNTAKDTLSSIGGCDSIITLNLTVNPAITNTLNAAICPGQSYVFNGVSYTTAQSGIIGNFSTAAGCDSVVTFNLTVSPYLTGIDVYSICQGQSYTFNGITYTTNNNTAKDTLVTVGGCDSIITLNLTVSPYLTGIDVHSICQGQSYAFNGITYTTNNNTAKDTLVTLGGCDSIITLNLTVSPYLTGIDVHSICQGQGYTFNGITYTTNNNTAKDTLVTVGGCDSIITLNLTVSPYLTGIDVHSICQGQGYTFNGITYTTNNNTAKDTLVTVGGCDSIVTLDLTVNPYLTGTDVQRICEGQSYTFNGITYTTNNNTATDTLKTIDGCDSIVMLDLKVNPLPDIAIDILSERRIPFCTGDSVLLMGRGATSFNWYNGSGLLLGTGQEISCLLPKQQNIISVSGTDDNNCTDTAQVEIRTEPCCQMNMPNAFSPNGDGLNDEIGPVTAGHPGRYRFEIFNRWGQMVFVSYKISDRWKGLMNNAPVESGTYFYHITGDCVNGEPLNMRGDIVLIR